MLLIYPFYFILCVFVFIVIVKGANFNKFASSLVLALALVVPWSWYLVAKFLTVSYCETAKNFMTELPENSSFLFTDSKLFSEADFSCLKAGKNARVGFIRGDNINVITCDPESKNIISLSGHTLFDYNITTEKIGFLPLMQKFIDGKRVVVINNKTQETVASNTSIKNMYSDAFLNKKSGEFLFQTSEACGDSARFYDKLFY